MRSSSHPADLHIASHVRLACEDLRAANALYEIENRYTAYHLEQAVEKPMPAVLVAEDVHVAVSESHRLDVLLDKIPEENPLRDGFRQLTHLTVYATTARYPKTAGRLSPEIDFDTVPELSAAVKDMTQRIVDHFGVDPAKDARTPARIVEPPRRARGGSDGDVSGGPG